MRAVNRAPEYTNIQSKKLKKTHEERREADAKGVKEEKEDKIVQQRKQHVKRTYVLCKSGYKELSVGFDAHNDFQVKIRILKTSE